MSKINHISKVIIFLIVALLFSSFKFSDWEYDKKSRVKIHKSISEIFNSGTYITTEIEGLQEAFYSIKEANSIIGYFVVAQAPSKFHQFDYHFIFNDNAEVLKVEILKYIENYVAEICSKKWLKQFIKKSTANFSDFNRSVDGISGATLSVNSVKTEVFKMSEIVKKEIVKR